MQIGILWPTFVLVALIYAIWLFLFVKRIGHMKANPPRAADFETGEAALRYFTPVEMPANNLRNLFEMPVLYFALVPLLLITRHGNHIEVALAWIFVFLRVIHSIIHATNGPVKARFLVYLLSCVVLSAMWIGFAVDLALGR
jgi:hypothetical protein